jgi:hypothetical protein
MPSYGNAAIRQCGAAVWCLECVFLLVATAGSEIPSGVGLCVEVRMSCKHMRVVLFRGFRNFCSCLRIIYAILLPDEQLFRNLQWRLVHFPFANSSDRENSVGDVVDVRL